MEKNVEIVKNKIPTKTKIMAVIKADAYGHGAVPVAEFLSSRVEWFGVSNVDEALEIRRAGINNPILVLGYVSPEEYYAVVKNDITIALFSYADAEKLSRCAEEAGATAKVHIKADTGMSRIGYAICKDSAREVKRISELPHLSVTGVFSHFACADNEDKTSALRQRAQFDDFISMLGRLGVDIPCCHINNSAGIMELDKPYDMVRMGIILYGLYPSGEKSRDYRLHPAMRLVSRITMVKEIKKGTGVGYGHTYTAKRDMKIGTVAAGYADGYPRSLSNKGTVSVNGIKCPVIGRVCMDQLMIDLTNAENAKQGDEVLLFGGGEDGLSADEVAGAAGIIGYELICGVGRRVPRNYYRNGELVKTVSYII